MHLILTGLSDPHRPIIPQQPAIALSELSSRAGFGSASITRALSNRRAASSASSAGGHTHHASHTGAGAGAASSALVSAVSAAGSRGSSGGSGSSDPLRRSLLRWRSSSSAPQDRSHSSAPSASSSSSGGLGGLNASSASSTAASAFPADDVSALLIDAVLSGLAVDETRAVAAAHEVCV